MSNLKIFTDIASFQRWREEIEKRPSATAPTRIGLVPTMGALHAGHADLLARVRPHCDFSVLSIFVNPTQFGPAEDFSKYPRAFERDVELARQHGVDVVFAPTPEQMYPTAYSTFVEETSATKPLCGIFRPTHFRGVTTVVLKLFNIVRPTLALFGLKDAQQFFVLRKMALDLNLTIELGAVATVRESSGLAMSSRNAYLLPEHRRQAPLFQRILSEISKNPSPAAIARGKEELKEAGFEVQYIELLNVPGLTPATEDKSPKLLAGAVILGQTRLIDNLILNQAELADHGVRIY